jgi:hypothetical protein
MGKKLQFVIGVSCLVITGLGVYYFASYLPAKDMLALQNKCLDLGEKKVKQFADDNKEADAAITHSDYVFDREGKRCLFRTSYESIPNLAYVEKSVTDLFINKEIAGYVEMNERITQGNIGAFRLLEINYFESQ